MNKNQKNVIIQQILSCNFSKASILIKEMKYTELENLLLSIGYDNGQSIVIYAFICYLIEQENKIELHFIAQSILCGPLCYIEGAYTLALYHNKIVLSIDKDNVKAMTMMLFFNTLPTPLISAKEAKKYANKILEKEPYNNVAIQFTEQ